MIESIDSVRYYAMGEKLHTDRCIWCGSTDELSESHLIQEALGINFFTRTTCVPCNSFLGAKVESEALKNNFIAAGTHKIGLKTRREAYRHSKMFDEATGAEMMITKEGKSKPIPKKISENQFRGTPQEGKAYWLAQLNKERPNWPTRPLEEFFDDPKRKSFSYAGKNYVKQTHDKQTSLLRIEMGKYVDPKLVFKIAYEFLVLNSWHTNKMIGNALKQLFKVHRTKEKTWIYFSSQIDGLTINNIDGYFRKYEKLEEIPYGKYHAIIPRLSDRLVFYVDVVFFGVLRNCFILGTLNEWDDRIIPLLNTGYIFPIGGGHPYNDQYPNLKYKDHVIWSDVSVETRLWELEQIKKEYPNEPQ